MKWIQEPGLMQVLTLSEWMIMVGVFGILIVAGWAVIQFIKVMRGK